VAHEVDEPAVGQAPGTAVADGAPVGAVGHDRQPAVARDAPEGLRPEHRAPGHLGHPVAACEQRHVAVDHHRRAMGGGAVGQAGRAQPDEGVGQAGPERLVGAGGGVGGHGVGRPHQRGVGGHRCVAAEPSPDVEHGAVLVPPRAQLAAAVVVVVAARRDRPGERHQAAQVR